MLQIKPIRTYGFYDYDTGILSTADVMVISMMHSLLKLGRGISSTHIVIDYYFHDGELDITWVEVCCLEPELI